MHSESHHLLAAVQVPVTVHVVLYLLKPRLIYYRHDVGVARSNLLLVVRLPVAFDVIIAPPVHLAVLLLLCRCESMNKQGISILMK